MLMFHTDEFVRFHSIFTDEVKQEFVCALRTVYQAAQEHVITGIEGTPNLFGNNVYWLGVEELSQLVEKQLISGIKLISARPKFRLQLDKYTIAHHRVGSYAYEDIRNSFPKSKNGPGQLAHDNQTLYLPGLGFGAEIEEVGSLVLAHLGNLRDGLCAAYLCIPSREENGRISEWGHCELLWKQSASVPDTSSTIIAPYHEVILEPATVSPKKKEKEKTGNNE